jgi:hypothetical protein
MAGKVTPLRRRIAPSVPLNLTIVNEDGSTFAVSLQVRFDFNVLARIEEKTGLKMLSGMDMWAKLSASVLSIMLWSAAIPSNPDYDSPEGLEAIRSYLNKETADQAANALWEAYLLFLPKKEADLVREMKEKSEKGEAVEANPPTVEQPSASNSDGSTSGQSPKELSESASSASAS